MFWWRKQGYIINYYIFSWGENLRRVINLGISIILAILYIWKQILALSYKGLVNTQFLIFVVNKCKRRREESTLQNSHESLTTFIRSLMNCKIYLVTRVFSCHITKSLCYLHELTLWNLEILSILYHKLHFDNRGNSVIYQCI